MSAGGRRGEPGEPSGEAVRRGTEAAAVPERHEGEGYGDARRAQVLEARARRLARPDSTPRTAPGETIELVCFRTDAGEEYALEAKWILEVFRPGPLTRLPGARAPAAALASWRGEIVPVLDLGQILGRGPRALPRETMALVLGTDRPAFMILATQVPVTESRPRSSLAEPAPGSLPAPGLFVGVDGEGRALLDGEELLSRHG